MWCWRTVKPRSRLPMVVLDAVLSADAETWQQIAADVRSGMDAYRSGRLSVRRNLHVGVGFLAATSGATEPRAPAVSHGRHARRAAVDRWKPARGRRCWPCTASAAPRARSCRRSRRSPAGFRVIAVDLPGLRRLGQADRRRLRRALLRRRRRRPARRARARPRPPDRQQPRRARRAGDRACAIPSRVGRLALLAPSLAWRRERPWAPLLRLTRPELGLVQLAPRPVVEAIVHRLIPGAEHGWTAAGVDEFLRAYLTPAGRAAFYAAARQIYLEEPHGEEGFWTRLRDAAAPMRCSSGAAATGWCRSPSRATSPTPFRARAIVELDCGHVPQIERARADPRRADRVPVSGRPSLCEVGSGGGRRHVTRRARRGRLAGPGSNRSPPACQVRPVSAAAWAGRRRRGRFAPGGCNSEKERLMPSASTPTSGAAMRSALSPNTIRPA